MRLFKNDNKDVKERVYKDYVYKIKELVDKINHKYGLNSIVIDNKEISKNKIVIFCEVGDSQIKGLCTLSSNNEKTMIKCLEEIYNNGFEENDFMYSKDN